MGARRLFGAVAMAGLLGSALTACGAGFDAPTSQDLPSVPGANVTTDDGSVDIRNVYVDFDLDGYPAGGDAPVQVWMSNHTYDPVRLVEIFSEQADSVTVDGETQIEAQGWLQVTMQANNLNADFGSTDVMPLELRFDNGAVAQLRAPMTPPMEPLPREPMDLGGH